MSKAFRPWSSRKEYYMDRSVPRVMVLSGMALVLTTALIHLVAVPVSFSESAFRGLVFLANAVGAIVAAVGIYRGSRIWGWGLGLPVTAIALLSYLYGLISPVPGLAAHGWLGVLELLSLPIEGAFIIVYVLYLRYTDARSGDKPLPPDTNAESKKDGTRASIY
jgi:hypothetical protein